MAIDVIAKKFNSEKTCRYILVCKRKTCRTFGLEEKQKINFYQMNVAEREKLKINLGTKKENFQLR